MGQLTSTPTFPPVLKDEGVRNRMRVVKGMDEEDDEEGKVVVVFKPLVKRVQAIQLTIVEEVEGVVEVVAEVEEVWLEEAKICSICKANQLVVQERLSFRGLSSIIVLIRITHSHYYPW